MRFVPVLAVLLVIVVGPFVWGWLFGARPTAAKIQAARERAERVQLVGDLPWEKPDWQQEFEWSKNHSTAKEADSRPQAERLPADDAGVPDESPREAEGAWPAADAARIEQASAPLGVAQKSSIVLGDDPEPVDEVRCKVVLMQWGGNRLEGLETELESVASPAAFAPQQLVTDALGELEIHGPLGRYRLRSALGQVEFDLREGLERLELTLDQ